MICTFRFLTDGKRADTFVREMTQQSGPCWDAHWYGSRLTQFKTGTSGNPPTKFKTGTSGNPATKFKAGNSVGAATRFKAGNGGTPTLGGVFGLVGGTETFESLRGLARGVRGINASSLSRALDKARQATPGAGYVEFTTTARLFYNTTCRQ